MSTPMDRVRHAVSLIVADEAQAGFLGALEVSEVFEEGAHESLLAHLQSDGLLVLFKFEAEAEEGVTQTRLMVGDLGQLEMLQRIVTAAIVREKAKALGGDE